MKKLSTILLGLCFVLLAACSANTPSDVAEKAMGHLADGEADKFVDMVYIEPDTPDEGKAMIKNYLTGFLNFTLHVAEQAHGGYDKIRAVSEKVDEKAGTATVEMKVTYEDNTTENKTINLRKDKNGMWKVVFSK